MKIKTQKKSYDEVKALPRGKHINPKRPSRFLQAGFRLASAPELKQVHFTCERIGMERLGKEEPCLVLMNHSSFIDLKIALTLMKGRPLSVVCTSDGFVGKDGLMRSFGCIPTKKFVSDATLVKDMLYALKTVKSSVLMYPEASYSFDGTPTPLPESLGKCLKLLKVPVVMISTFGAFTRDPLYNNLQLRKVDVSARMEYALSPQEIAQKSPDQLNEILKELFTFDHFRWQQQQQISVTEPFRADDLNRVLYKCPHCLTEGKMKGKGIQITCGACGKGYELTEFGKLEALEGEGKFDHIPDWYAWERECVREEINAGTYNLTCDVDIYMMVDTKCVYQVGEGTLVHNGKGFTLDGCDGKLHYEQSPKASYSLYADYFWYEIGDVICIGSGDALYYCFPKAVGDVVAKTRLATEELYKSQEGKV